LIHNNKISGLKIGYEYNGVPNLKISANNNPNLSCIEVPTAYLEGWQNINLPTGNIDNGVIFSDNCAGSAIPQSERNALITIYNAYHNPDYESAGYWQYWDPNPDGLSNVGSWQGVTTGYIDGQKHVVEFVMPGHSYNNLTAEFPEELGNLTQLVKFELPFVCCGHTHGYITSFPESIGDLSHLEELFIRQSGIEQLPEGFGNLAALQQLSITNNAQLNSLSEDFGELSALIELNLTHNALESLPLSFGDLYETLTNLDLSYNDITGELPFNFNTFTLLTQLYLRDNSMEGYLNLGNLELLTRLDIQNNLFNGLKLAVSPTAMQGNCGNGNPCYFNAENNNMYCIEVPTDELVSWQLANTNVDNCVIFSDHCGEEVSSDTTPPTVVTQNITVNLTEEGTLMITPESVMHYTTQDECSIGTAELDITSFDCSHIGENTVTLTVYDISGNSASQSAIVTVTENTPPTIATQDLTVNLGSNGEVTIAPEDIDNGSEDNCGITLMELSQSTFNCSHIGENQIYLEVEDASGNSSWEYVTITITETTPPTVLTQSLSVELDENGTASITPEQIDNGSTD
ncbi:hypothetical protein RBU60_00670, partial [Mesonia sp. MT50]|nr:hypothetical protein [Mesonia profundi]